MSDSRRVTTAIELKPKGNEKFFVRAWNSLRKAALDLWQKSGEESGVSDEISARMRSGTIDAKVKLSQIDHNQAQAALERVRFAKEQELFELEKEALTLKNEKIREEIEQIRDERLLTKIQAFREAGYSVDVRDFNGTVTVLVEDNAKSK